MIKDKAKKRIFGKKEVGIVARVLSAALLGCIVLGMTVGCADEEQVQQGIEAPDSIIGGYNANNALLNHTGALIVDYYGDLEPFCTASMIDDERVVTAKHCAEILYWYGDVYFGVGPDSYNPDDLILIAAVEMAPSDAGGFTGYGQDVAVLHLDRAPNVPVTPITPMEATELEVGDRMVSMGYGVFGAGGGFDGKRRIGRETVEATEGYTLEALFGDLESFVEWWLTGDVTDEDYMDVIDDYELEYVMEIWESEVLLPDDEIVTGLNSTDTQSCNGDSGGPLMKYQRGVGWVTYGVVSGGLYSARSECEYGTIFATFGPEVMDFIEETAYWEDPCGDVSAEGACVDNVALNCTSDAAEGIREIEEQDCSEIENGICVVIPGGAGCGVLPDADSDSSTDEEVEIVVEVDIDVAIEIEGVDAEAVKEAISEAFYYHPERKHEWL